MASESGVQPFVTHFQGKTKLTSCDFLKIFRAFDKDGMFVRTILFLYRIFKCEQFSIAHSPDFDVNSPVENTVVVFFFDRKSSNLNTDGNNISKLTQSFELKAREVTSERACNVLYARPLSRKQQSIWLPGRNEIYSTNISVHIQF